MTQCLCIAKWNFNCRSVNNRIVNCYLCIWEWMQILFSHFRHEIENLLYYSPLFLPKNEEQKSCVVHLQQTSLQRLHEKWHHSWLSFSCLSCPTVCNPPFLAVTNESALWALWFQFLTKLLQNVNKSITSKYLQMRDIWLLLVPCFKGSNSFESSSATLVQHIHNSV